VLKSDQISLLCLAARTGVDPILTFRKLARFRRKSATISALTADLQVSQFAEIARNYAGSSVRICPKNFFLRVSGNGKRFIVSAEEKTDGVF
jgi:hypothetical protein